MSLRHHLIANAGIIQAGGYTPVAPPVSGSGIYGGGDGGGTVDWSTIDGRGAAPTGSPQYPTYFTSLNGITAYPARPPWKVPGVDYRVGINTGVVLKNPTTLDWTWGDQNATTKVWTIQADGLVFDGYDFSGWHINNSAGYNLTFRNCKFTNFAIDSRNDDTKLLDIQYCEFDGLGAAGETAWGTLITVYGRCKLWYNYIHDSQGDMVDTLTSNMDARYNLFDTMGYNTVGGVAGTLHPDGIQFYGSGIANAIKILFNTYVHMHVTLGSPSSFIDCEAATGGAMTNPEIAYNVASNTFPGTPTSSQWIRLGTTPGGTVDGGYVHDNWMDTTNTFGALDERAPGTNFVKANNKLLTTGAAF